VVARFTIRGVNLGFREWRRVLFTDAGISHYDQNNRVTTIGLSLSLAVPEETPPTLDATEHVSNCLKVVEQPDPVIQSLDDVGAITAWSRWRRRFRPAPALTFKN
jgi:hypothetical protein